MRSRVIALLAAAIGIAMIPVAAEAGRRGWQDVYYPYYHRHLRSDGYLDPHRYRYEPRRYYPYYNSGYWRPTWELRRRAACCRPFAELPPYYQAWGYPKRYNRWNSHYRSYRRW